MKKSWFQHYPMEEREANQLLNTYKLRGVKAQKHLTGDPRFYVVTAFLPVSNYVPKSQHCFQNPMWL